MAVLEKSIVAFLSTGDGYGSGYGDGDGDGYGYGIKSFCGSPVHMVDGVPTLIDHIHGGTIAKGRILRRDLTTIPCYIVKNGGYFGHGETLREAMEAVRAKALEDATPEERCEAFMERHKLGEQYPVADLYQWHHDLTGSCEMGRKQFAADHGIDINHDTMTVERFIALTRNAYGGDVVRLLEKMYKEGEESPPQDARGLWP